MVRVNFINALTFFNEKEGLQIKIRQTVKERATTQRRDSLSGSPLQIDLLWTVWLKRYRLRQARGALWLFTRIASVSRSCRAILFQELYLCNKQRPEGKHFNQL